MREIKFLILLILISISFKTFALTFDEAVSSANNFKGSQSSCYFNYSLYSSSCSLKNNVYSGWGNIEVIRVIIYTDGRPEVIGSVYSVSYVGDGSCPAGQTRPTPFETCKSSTPACNTVPTITNVGSTQTVSWQVLDPNTVPPSCVSQSRTCDLGTYTHTTGTIFTILTWDTQDAPDYTCIPHTLTCAKPLIPNEANKSCDRQCSDGTIVDASSGAQCPPTICKGQQTLDSVTDTCEEPVCGTTEHLDVVTHICELNVVCKGEQIPDLVNNSCIEPVCTGSKILNTVSHICEALPAECIGSQVLNTVTNSCDDPVCPIGQHLNAGKVCEADGTDGTGTDGTGTDTGGTGTDQSGKCDDCAKESTLQQVSKKLDANQGTSTSGTGDAGKWYEPTDKTYKSVIQGGISQIQNTPIMSFGKDIFNVTIPEGTPPVWTLPAVMGMPEIQLPSLDSGLMNPIWLIVSSVLKIISVLMAFRIAMSAV